MLSPLWVLMLIILLLLDQDLIHLESVENFIISQVPSFLLLAKLLSLPKYISMILKNSWLKGNKIIGI